MKATASALAASYTATLFQPRLLTTPVCFVACLMLSAACKTAAVPPPSQAGMWHLEGSSNALFQTTDGGDFGDSDEISASIQGGRFVSDAFLIEGVAAASNIDDDDDEELTSFDLGGGARYYFTTEGTTRPYVAGLAGIRNIDIDLGALGSDSDTAPVLQARGGLELFISASVAIDIGVAWQEVFGLELGSVEDDLTTFAAYAGVAVWL